MTQVECSQFRTDCGDEEHNTHARSRSSEFDRRANNEYLPLIFKYFPASSG